MEWIQANEAMLTTLGVLSVVTFVVSLLVLPIIIIIIPADFFSRPSGQLPSDAGPLRLLLHLIKNCFGVLIFVLGLLMLFLPGQGILAMLLGCSLVDFPGKRRLQLKLLRGRRVRRSVNWIRQKGGRAPLIIPDSLTEL